MATILFFDDWALCAMENVQRIRGQPRWVPAATLEDPLTEGTWNFPFVWRDETTGRWRAIYGAAIPNGPRSPLGFLPRSQALMLAESDDGLRWTRPDVSALISPGIRQHAPNQVFGMEGHIDGAPVFLDDHDPDPARRFKYLFARSGKQGLATSPDGIRWSVMENVLLGDYSLDSPVTAFFNHHRGTYCISRRPHNGDRRIAFFETTDWQSVLRQEVIIHPSPEDPPLIQFYGMPVYRYENLYLGLLWRLHCHPTEEVLHKGLSGGIDCALAYSHDGWHFNRATHEALIPRNERGAHGGGCIYTGTMLVTPEHEIRFYSGGSKSEHFIDQEQTDAALLVHTLRLDGFFRLESRVRGRVMTRLVAFSGPDLRLNARAPHGRVCVQISAERGEPVPGFTFDDCTPFKGDDLFWQPGWKDGRTLAQLAGNGRYHIEVELHDAELYAIRGDFQMAFGWGREKAPLRYEV
jgi:hypothetical protein